jgi:hypothetical protein
MNPWPTGWREHALRRAEIPINDFTMDVLNLWERATPTDRWTNNPLGIPAEGFSAPRALRSNYAAFPTMQHFYTAFRTAAHMGHGSPLLSALATQEKYSVAWRAINQLGWPANGTETDYPSHVLDKVTEAIPANWKISKPEDRKTVGLSVTGSRRHSPVIKQAELLHQAASRVNDAAAAIAQIARGMGYGGR